MVEDCENGNHVQLSMRFDAWIDQGHSGGAVGDRLAEGQEQAEAVI